MPTYRNATGMQVNYETGGKIYCFPAGRDTGTTIYVPYKELGLELVDENYPPLKSKVLISGRFKFSRGMERKIKIPYCVKYRLQVTAPTGRLKVYLGGSSFGMELSGGYEGLQEWNYAPYIRLVGIDDGTECVIYAEESEQ